MNNDKPLTQGDINRFEKYVNDIANRKIARLNTTTHREESDWKDNFEKQLNKTQKGNMERVASAIKKLKAGLPKGVSISISSEDSGKPHISLSTWGSWNSEQEKRQLVGKKKVEEIQKVVQRFREQIIFGNREEIVKALRELEGL